MKTNFGIPIKIKISTEISAIWNRLKGNIEQKYAVCEAQ